MIGAFAEAVRATWQPCTLLLLVPALAVVVATRCSWRSMGAVAFGAVLGGWVLIGGRFVLDGFWIRASAAAVVLVLVLLVVAPRRPGLGWIRGAWVETAAAGAVALVATLWWRPCVGRELGVIITAARRDLVGQFPGMAAYMLGAMVPVAVVVALLRTVPIKEAAVTATTWIGSLVGIVVAGALAAGRHGDVVEVLNRLTTGA